MAITGTFTYLAAPGSSTAAQRRDAVRLTVGDTVEQTAQLSDEEIAFFLNNQADDILLASVEGIDAILARRARDQENSHHGSSVKPRDLKNLEALRDRLIARASFGALWFAGGVSKTANETFEDNTDNVKHEFAIGDDDIDGLTKTEREWL